MTSISGNSAVLSILTQTSPLAASNKSAADTILDIVSGGSTGATDKAEEARLAKLAAQKAKIAALDLPREVGGTVSSELTSAQLSAMGQIAAGTTLAQAPIQINAWEQSAKNAEVLIAATASVVNHYNAKFKVSAAPSREEYNAQVEESRLLQLERGIPQDIADAQAAKYLTDEAYANRLIQTEVGNANLLTLSLEAENGLQNMRVRLQSAYGVEIALSHDDTGMAKLSAFDVVDGSGRKIANYDDDGSLTIFNEDGSARKTLAAREIRTLGYY